MKSLILVACLFISIVSSANACRPSIVFFPNNAIEFASIADGWDDPSILAQLSPDLRNQLSEDLLTMKLWNRRADALLVMSSFESTPRQKFLAEEEASRLDKLIIKQAVKMGCSIK